MNIAAGSHSNACCIEQSCKVSSQAALWVSQIACTHALERVCVHAVWLTQSVACEDMWPPVFVLETAKELRRDSANCASSRSEF